MKNNENLLKNFVHLARVALSERNQDVHTFLNRLIRGKDIDPEIAEELISLLRKSSTRASPLRKSQEIAMPVDADSRFQLLRIEEVPILAHEPIYSDAVQNALGRLVQERTNLQSLLRIGLEATRTVLFTGPPGVGKTLAARWVARELKRPLLILDLAAVMSSYLGRTGSNLRHVLDYAKSIDCVLLLDELDAIAKRRDDIGEVGELKRLVTVLLQQLDDWPSKSLLIAATNHSELLDPAVWRRFEEIVKFPLPEKEGAAAFISGLLKGTEPDAEKWSTVLSLALHGNSFSEIEREVNIARRAAALNGKELSEHLERLMNVENLPKQDRINLAVELVKNGLVSQRRAHELTYVARDTIRERLK